MATRREETPEGGQGSRRACRFSRFLSRRQAADLRRDKLLRRRSSHELVQILSLRPHRITEDPARRPLREKPTDVPRERRRSLGLVAGSLGACLGSPSGEGDDFRSDALDRPLVGGHPMHLHRCLLLKASRGDVTAPNVLCQT